MTTSAGLVQGVISGHHDFEIGDEPRAREMKYTLGMPKDLSSEKPARGLVFYIAGFGEDTDQGYLHKLREFLSEEYGYIVCTVEYHCYFTRPLLGAKIVIDELSNQFFHMVGKLVNAGLPDQGPFDMTHVRQVAERVKDTVKFQAVIKPKYNEYQNFGLLQAVDHLTVLYDLIREGLPFDHNNIIIVGSSHGGYIGHLMAKLAPGTINAIIDNSSYVRTPLPYLGVGDIPEFIQHVGSLQLFCHTETRWQFKNRELPTYFGLPQHLIRETINLEHLQLMKEKAFRLPIIYAFNSEKDGWISPLEEKQLQQSRYQDVGIEYHLKTVTESDIDGKRFKTLQHGMNASMKTLCNDILPKIESRSTQLEYQQSSVLSFPCQGLTYEIQHDLTQGPQCRLIRG